VGRKHLEPGIARLRKQPVERTARGDAVPPPRLTAVDWKRIGAIIVFFMAASLFWGGYEQAGSSLNLFADRYVDLHVFGFAFPASWYISVQAAFVIILSPVFAWAWLRLGSRQPSSPAKFALALLFVGLAFLLLVPAGRLAMTGTKISPLWLVGAYFIEELGELSLSPVGLSVVTKLAPTRIVGLMMGVWFLSNAAGNKIAGWTAQFVATVPLDKLFLMNAAVMVGAAMVMFLLIKPVRNLMGGVQ
jgi:POT family proton-dependent oligopeptide transporter